MGDVIGQIIITKDKNKLKVGNYPSDNPNLNDLWLDTSGKTKRVLKSWNGISWEIVNDYSDDISDVVSNLETNYYTKTETNNQVESIVGSTTITTQNGEVLNMKNAISSALQTANKIKWLVKDESSSSSIQLTKSAIDFISENINLRGNATFSSIVNYENNQTNIIGDYIQTGFIRANSINLGDDYNSLFYFSSNKVKFYATNNSLICKTQLMGNSFTMETDNTHDDLYEWSAEKIDDFTPRINFNLSSYGFSISHRDSSNGGFNSVYGVSIDPLCSYEDFNNNSYAYCNIEARYKLLTIDTVLPNTYNNFTTIGTFDNRINNIYGNKICGNNVCSEDGSNMIVCKLHEDSGNGALTLGSVESRSCKGILYLYGSSTGCTTITSLNSSSYDYNIYFPNKSGTLALQSDIETVNNNVKVNTSKIDNHTNDISLIRKNMNTIASSIITVTTSASYTQEYVPVNSGSSEIIQSFILSAGKYILEASLYYASNTTGVRKLYLGTNSEHTNERLCSITLMASNNGATMVHLCRVLSVSTNTQINLIAWQNSGKTLNVNGGHRITKIG